MLATRGKYLIRRYIFEPNNLQMIIYYNDNFIFCLVILTFLDDCIDNTGFLPAGLLIKLTMYFDYINYMLGDVFLLSGVYFLANFCTWLCFHAMTINLITLVDEAYTFPWLKYFSSPGYLHLSALVYCFPLDFTTVAYRSGIACCFSLFFSTTAYMSSCVCLPPSFSTSAYTSGSIVFLLFLEESTKSLPTMLNSLLASNSKSP